jgi:PAS domain S-box-containing protein
MAKSFMIVLPGVAIQTKIYESSASLVYRGIREEDGRAIVVKLLKQDYPSSQELIRYRQEYQITRSLNLEGVVRAYDQQHYKRTLAIFLEDFGGESLERWIQQRPHFCPMPLSIFLPLAIKIIDILGKIHAAGIIHKDINPGNIVLNLETGVVKIIDFGIATRFNRINPTFKNPHMLEGTLAYLSPEQTGRMNRLLDYRTDFYSLSVTFYQLLTGRLPFPTKDVMELVHCHIAKQPVPPHKINAAIPKPASDIILKLMAKNAENRYQSDWGIKADLELCFHQLESTGQIDRIQLALQDASAQFQIPQKLYGREAEIAALLTAFDRVAGGSGTARGRERETERGNIPVFLRPRVPVFSAMMLVSGYAGVGKSALVQELYKPITAKRGYFISGKFDQLQRNIPYSAITSALQKLVQQLLSEPDEQVQKWRSQLLNALGSNGQLIIDVISEVELIIGKQPSVPEVGAMEAQNRFNRVFQQFIGVFCSEEHPLAIFLDDLQWVDSATLKLIESLLLDEQTQFLFLIGAYRDNEVNPTHPLASMLEKLQQQGAVLQEIVLAPLTLEPLNQLIAEILHQDVNTVRSLTELVLNKTEGNPFFVGELLRSLHSENLLSFNAEHLSWQWNINQIQALNITDNVVELLLSKLRKLPEVTQRRLRLAACIGSEFDLETLAIVCEQSPKTVFQDLLTAVQAGFIQPISELDEDLLVQNYKFLHDRVQQSEFEQVDYWAETVLQEANSIFDAVKVYEVKIQTEIAQNQRLKAVNTGLQVLQQLGISFSEEPTQSDIQRELDAIASHLKETPIEDLVHLPEMTNPDKLATMRILSSITIAAHNAAPDLMPLLVSKQVNLSIQYGNAFVSPFAYATYGFILCREVGDIEAGYEFGQLALKLLSQLKTHSLRAGTSLFINHFINHWKEHIRESLEPLLEAYRSGLETGNLEAAAYCAYTYCFQLYVSGKELVEVERKMATYGEAIRQIKQEAPLIWAQIFHQAVLNLMGCSTNPTRLIGKSYNEENRSPQTEAANSGIAATVYFHKFVLCYLFSEYVQAVENLVLAESYLFLGTGSLGEPPYYFYGSLVRLAIYPQSSTQAQEEILEKVALSQEKMKRWAHYAPMNCLHKYHLVEAEKARVLGQLLEAEKFYEQAIQGARENEYIQEEALAYELAAKHYLARGLEKFAQLYMKEAHYCYERWGAIAKVKDLETRYPQLFSQSSNVVSTPVRTTTGTSSNTSHIALDLAAVMKAAQAISGEIELEQLLSSLMQILIENAGAQTGSLILESAGEWSIEAAGELSSSANACTTKVLKSIPIVNRLPESIIQYVIRTHESVILNDATREGNFTHDPYIQHNQTKSILCLPLLNQSQLIGVLCLENQLAVGAFTPERTQVLHLLSAQAAIAIQNAKLYSEVRASESKMAQFLEAVPVGIGVLDAAGRVYYVNQRGIQLMGKGIDPATTPEQIPEVYQFYLAGTDHKYPTEKLPIVRALSGERTTIDDVEIRQNDKIIPVEVWGTPIFDRHGNVHYAIAAFQDITERKQAEKLLADYNSILEQQVAKRTAALQESEATLRHREQELRLITDALPVCISYVNANQLYCFVNRTYEDWFSRNRDQILGKHVREILGERAYQVVEPYINQVFEGQTATLEVEMPLQSGKRYISTTLIPDLDDNAQVRGFYALNTDISNHKKAEEILRQSEAQFREQAILSTFRADVDSALAQSDSLSLMLHRCAEAVVKHFNAAFARIWTLDKDKDVLELQASVGMYTRLDGTYSRVSVGSSKVGRIAQDRCPLLTNNVFFEPSIDREWAEQEGMVAFAGYPILLDDQLVGVIAMFTRHIIPLSNFEALEFAAREIALGIRRKQAEVALQDSEAELRALFSAMPDPLLVVNAEGYVLRANLIESEKLYKPIDEQVGRTLHEIFERSQADTFLGYIRQALSTQRSLTVEYSLMIGGWKTWFATRISPISEYSVIWLARDITDRKRAEAASILEERNRMAREIHDTLAQAFTGILIYMGTVSRLASTNPNAIQAHINTVRDLARSGLTEARRSVAALRPQSLENSNLWTALERFVATLQSSTEISLVCEIIGTPYVLPAETENNLLRIAQEAFTNAVRYANATEIRIELVYESMQCCLRIRDNGQGFEASHTTLNRGFGLLGITERAELIGAQLSIESQLGRGTEVIVYVNRKASL